MAALDAQARIVRPTARQAGGTGRRAQPSTEAAPVTGGGVEGVVLEAAVRADADLPCTGLGPYLPMLADDAALQWGFEPHMRKRLYLLGLRRRPYPDHQY